MKFRISFLFILTFFFYGCAMNEIEDYDIVSGIGFDYIDELFQVTYEIYEENTHRDSACRTAHFPFFLRRRHQDSGKP